MKPRYLIWVTVDKDSFECLISKLENLNLFLITLLDSSQLRRLQNIININYLEILQLWNNVVSLITLIKALIPIIEDQWESLHENISPKNDFLSQIIAEETLTQEKRKKYLKQLVEIKIHFIILSQLDSKAIVVLDSKFIDILFLLDEFIFAKGVLEYNALQQWMSATYWGDSVWIEWKATPADNDLDPENK